MIYDSSQNRKDYCPAFLGNGDIALATDTEGTLNYTPIPGIDHMQRACIFRAGRRRIYKTHKNIRGELFGFGSFKLDCSSKLIHFVQELVLPDGYQRSLCEYEEGKIDSEWFVHQEHPLFAMKKHFWGISRTVSYVFSRDGEVSALKNCEVSVDGDGVRLFFLAEGQDDYRGEVRIFLDRECRVDVSNGEITLSFDVSDGDAVSMFLCLEDDLFCEMPQRANAEVYKKVKKMGFDLLLQENTKLWREYFDLGYVKTDDKRLNSVYMTACYHLKCFTTRWSIPVGLYDGCWEGRFFAFDEYYGFLGLIGSGRFELAKRVPEFRLKTCLKIAIKRATANATPAEDRQARFMWETLEYGNEGAPYHHAYDHVFHMCVIALGAYEYYEYTGDVEFLSECYEMIHACAKFFTLNMIYFDDGKPYIGKCTDLERLGDSRERAFMTTCGAVRLLEICAKTSEILDIDREYGAECADLSEKLLHSLPEDGEKYVPFPNSPYKSIGVFSCKFPFDVLKSDDPKMLRAFEDYIENEHIYGNMYRTGKRISAWYSCWKAEAYARCGMAKEAMKALVQTYESLGAFDEIFEINEEARRMRPWFMTGAAVFLSAVNDMLIKSDGERIDLLDAFDGKNVSFKLLAKGGFIVEADIEGGEVTRLELTAISSQPLPKVYFKGKRIR